MTMIGGWGVTPAEVSIALPPLGIVLTLLSSCSRAAVGPLRARADDRRRLGHRGAVAFAGMGLPAPLPQYLVRGAAADDLLGSA